MAIQFKNVTYSYPQYNDELFKAIENINLNIGSTGEFITLVGHTGSGKSTLVQHMNALVRPTNGYVSIFGVKVEKPNFKNRKTKLNPLRSKVGLVFQFADYQLFETSVLQDVMFGPMNFGVKKAKAKEMSINALKHVGLDESYYDRVPFQLSGGEKKRVSIAGILAIDPDILVLDEPTSGLDPLGRKEIMDLLLELHNKENKSIIVITHDMNIVNEYSKRVIVMCKSKLVFDGSSEKLFDNPMLKEWDLDYPEVYKILKELNKKLNKNINIHCKNYIDLCGVIEENFNE